MNFVIPRDPQKPYFQQQNKFQNKTEKYCHNPFPEIVAAEWYQFGGAELQHFGGPELLKITFLHFLNGSKSSGGCKHVRDERASAQARKRAGKRASEQASKRASEQASKRASTHASKRASDQAEGALANEGQGKPALECRIAGLHIYPSTRN
jgi:hypothetical protein